MFASLTLKQKILATVILAVALSACWWAISASVLPSS
jgi:hypothetical protein